jgi:HEAT repeat protein/CRP-like cAMP-binding protein
MGHLLHLLAGWLAEEKRLSDPYRRMGLQGRDWTRAMLHRGHYGAAEPLLEALGGIMTETAADPTRRAFAAEMLRGVAGQGTIDHLLEAAQAEGAPTPGSPGRSLALLLGVALDRLLDRLRDSHDMSERVRLIKVLSEVGGFSPQILVERIKGGGPWYFLRNLVLLLGKLGGEPHAAVLVPLLNHEDVRVRSEALNALHAIGGGMREKALLGALKTADERLRLSIVSMLGAMESSAAVPHLLQLLEARTLIGTRSRSELEEKICAALGRIGSPEALPVLQAIAEKKGLVPLRTYAAAVRQAAREALNAIAIRNPAGRRALPPSGAAGSEGQVEEAGPPEDLPAILAREEQRIARMIAEKGLDAAVQLLLQRILAYAHAGELEAAGRLRARLSEINPLALAELVQADDAIAQGRKGSFNHRELETWRELYDSLGAEEANALYVALRPLTVAAGETLVRPGDRNPDLFFVHSGELKVSCRTGSEERLVSIVGPGEVTGGESFFNATVATAAIGAVTRAELGLLSREAVDGWSTAFPDLGVKLREFCAPFGVAPQALEARGINRREHPRQAVEGEIHCRLEDAQGLPLGRAFKGRMVDASGGGICFQVRVATPPTAHLLLGRRLHCTLPGAAHLAMLPPPPLAGRVVAVRPLREDRFSIHLQFERPPQRGAQGQGPTAPA